MSRQGRNEIHSKGRICGSQHTSNKKEICVRRQIEGSICCFHPEKVPYKYTVFDANLHLTTNGQVVKEGSDWYHIKFQCEFHGCNKVRTNQIDDMFCKEHSNKKNQGAKRKRKTNDVDNDNDDESIFSSEE